MQGTRSVWGFGFPAISSAMSTNGANRSPGTRSCCWFNAHHEAIPFTLPSRGKGQEWQRLIDTADPEAEAIKRKGGEQYEIKGCSMVILRSKTPQFAELPVLTSS